MKKLLIALVVLALTVPAVAMATQPPKPGKPAPAPATTTYKNSAKLCKALQAANKSAFAAEFGKNGNLRNAYGKCVSAHARSKVAKVRTITLSNVVLNATGTITGAGAAGCQTSTAGCVLTSTGTLAGFLGGTYSSTFTVMWTQATANPAVTGAFCAPASGQVTVTLPGLGTLVKQETGKLCETQATGANVPHAFTGTFTVLSGTGVFSDAAGSGTSTFTQQPGTTSAQGGAVTGSETFETLTLKL